MTTGQPELGLVHDVVDDASACAGRASGVSPCSLDEREQRLERRARVDEHGRPAGARRRRRRRSRGTGVEAAGDEHRFTLPARRIRDAGASDRLEASPIVPGGHMPGLIARTMTIIKAKFSKLLDKDENPNETLDYSYEAAAAAAPERQARDRRRRDREEAARDPVHLDAAAGRQARRPGQGSAEGEPRGPRARGAHPQGGDRRTSSRGSWSRASSSRRSSRSSSRARRRSRRRSSRSARRRK